MVTCANAACDVLGTAAGDIELVRQRVIVHLLRRIPMGEDALCVAVRELLQCGVLTKDALPELGPSGFAFDAVQGLEPIPRPVSMAAMVPVTGRPWPAPLAQLGQASRFKQEFECIELLGRGAFGDVWRCRNRLDGREYAVKSVHYRASEADRIERRVLREAQTWASMDHPNIARYHSAWVEAEMPALGPVGRAPGAGGVALPLPAPEPVPDTQVETGTSITFATDVSDGGVTFHEASDPPLSAQMPVALPMIAEGRDQQIVKAERPVAGIVARRGQAAAANPARGLSSQGPTYGAVLYIQAELCSKDTLGGWIAKRNAAWTSGPTLPSDQRRWALEACRVFQECASAVAHLHARRCVHRDLKPSNVLFGHDGTVRLGDFGLAKVLDVTAALESGGRSREAPEDSSPASEAWLPETRGVGTPAYASPEQLAGASCGVKADVYALGVMLVELLTPVGTQMERAELLRDLRAGRWAAGGSFPRAARLVAAMTKPDPAERPTSEEVLQAFPEVALDVQQHFGSHALPGLTAAGSSGSESG